MKKRLLNEQVTRRMMKLANIGSLSENFMKETEELEEMAHAMGRDEDEKMEEAAHEDEKDVKEEGVHDKEDKLEETEDIDEAHCPGDRDEMEEGSYGMAREEELEEEREVPQE